jgi:chloride channel protein, CIC family
VEGAAGVGRPAVGGIALGLLLLALPQMYGVGYPVMDKTTAGGYALWFLVILAFGKILACSLSIGIGGSGGIFAPSLFIGVTSGYAYGDIVHQLFGASAGQPALYAVVAMGAVFASAARAPLTSLASVVEMSGDFSLTLPVMLAVAVASAAEHAGPRGLPEQYACGRGTRGPTSGIRDRETRARIMTRALVLGGAWYYNRTM